MNGTKLRSRGATAEGSALIGVLVVMLVITSSIAGMLWVTTNNTYETHRYVHSSRAFNAAEAGMQRALFLLSATGDWGALSNRHSFIAMTNFTADTAYAVAISNVSAREMTIQSTGRARFRDSHVYRRIAARVTRSLPEAFDFVFFGNRIGFHNHMRQPYGLTIESEMFSNGDITVQRGLVMDGDMTAVGQIQLQNTPNDVPETVVLGELRDGNPGSPYYAPGFGDPVPEVKAFPEYNWDKAKELAKTAGTWFATDADFQAYLAHYTTVLPMRTPFAFGSPLPGNPTNSIPLTDESGTQSGIVSVTAVANALFYIEEGVDLEAPCDTLLIMTNVSIVAEGQIVIARPTRLFAPLMHPALAAEGGINITDKDHTDGDGGPVYINGVIYTLGTCHIHQTDPYNAVYIKGVEIADYVHNCEWFHFVYESWPRLKGFGDSDESDLANIMVSGWHERPGGFF